MAMAQNITFIPAVKTVGTQKPAEKKQKVRVAAYCRVSTEFEEQESSYETQVAHYTSYINGNPEWEMVEVYADNGISGTRTAKREAFNRMIKDCEAGRIDMIITKSISRFSRNTVDCLKYTRKLKEMNIAVFFEKENINTLDAKGEVLMTIMAALAQQESESLSANVRLGIQFRNQQGKVQVNHNWFLGYTKDESGKLVIVPEEAEVVRRIYREYLEGASFVKIRRGLEADGILNGAKHARWHETNIKQILTNEKYIGEYLLKLKYGKSETLSALMLLYPSLDFGNRFHEDHMYPKSKFRKSYLRKMGVPEDQLDTYIDSVNDISNLQLLAAQLNEEKLNSDFDVWFNTQYPTDTDKIQYRTIHYLPDMDYTYPNFLTFLDKRKQLLRKKLAELLL